MAPRLRNELSEATTPELTAMITVPTVVRGEQEAIHIAPDTRRILLSFATPRSFPQYHYEIIREGGGVEFARTAPAPPHAQEELQLTVPTTNLDAGHYRVVLSGVENGQQTEIGHCRLEIAK